MAFKGTSNKMVRPKSSATSSAVPCPVLPMALKMHLDDADNSLYDPMFNKIGVQPVVPSREVIAKQRESLRAQIKYLCNFLKYSELDTQILQQAALDHFDDTKLLVERLHREYVEPLVNPPHHYFEQFLTSEGQQEEFLYLRYVTKNASCILQFEKSKVPSYLHHYHGATLDATQGAAFLDLLK